MTAAPRTFAGQFMHHVAKSRSRMVLTISLARDDGDAFLEDIGGPPYRPGAPVVICAGLATELSASEAEPYAFGEAVKLIAHLTVRASAYADAAIAESDLIKRQVVLEARNEVGLALNEAVAELDGALHAALAGRGRA